MQVPAAGFLNMPRVALFAACAQIDRNPSHYEHEKLDTLRLARAAGYEFSVWCSIALETKRV
jgi:hypothetical protein